MPRILAFPLLLLVSAMPAAGSEGWAFSLGVFDLPAADKSVEGGVEHRWKTFELWSLDLEPVVGFSANSDGGYWAYGGLRYDFEISDRWRITPQFAISLYERGDGKELGGPLEFRSGIELSYRLDSGASLGLVFYHLSNARIYHLNPGQESLVFIYSLGR